MATTLSEISNKADDLQNTYDAEQERIAEEIAALQQLSSDLQKGYYQKITFMQKKMQKASEK
jgi:hypothetical protein